MTPATGGNIVGGKNLSVTHSLAGAVESTPKPVVHGQSLLVNNGIALLSHNSFCSSVLDRDDPQQDPKQSTDESASVSAQKAAKGNNLSKRETPCCSTPQLTHSPATPRQRQAHTGSLSQNHCSLGNEWSEAEVRERGSLVQELVPDKEQHKQSSPGLYGSRTCQASRKNGPGVWGINEDQIRLWAAELLLALEGLHQQGVFCQDLNPRNLLLDASGKLSFEKERR